MSPIYDFVIIITTFNRKKMLERLLTQIEQEKKNFNILKIIIDDGSNEYGMIERKDFFYVKTEKNHGKKLYWKIINIYFEIVKNLDSKYYIVLPDDVEIKVNFFEESIRLFEKINDEKKICLNLLMDETRRNKINWTNFKPIEFDEFYKTQWNDLCFISEKKFFENLNYRINEISLDRWYQNENLSSGVGEQISIRLNNLGLSMYHVKRTLVIHDEHESKMNPTERNKNKLIAR